MVMTTPCTTTDFDALLEALDVADAAVRALYVKLADNPDLAPECETELRELQRKRVELAHQVGVAALMQWRTSRGAHRTSPEADATVQPAPPLSEPDVEPALEVTREAPSVETSVLVPTPLSPATESAAAPVPVSAQQLDEFKAAFLSPATPPRVVPRTDDRTILLALAAHVTIGDKVSTSGAFEHEVELLERAASDDRQKRWREMSREGQVRWMSLLVAWAKALEDDGVRLQESTSQVAAVFRVLRAFSIHDNPGFVHGFARTASPKRGTWRMDALRYFREVRPELVPIPAKPKTTTMAKAAVPEAASEEDEGPEQEELAGWPHLERVKGLRVALLGGEAREERRVALERAFQFDSLEWVPTDRPRLVASLAERAAGGNLDFILVTKFVRHKETIAIERASQAPLLSLRHGYGVATVRQAFDDYFSRIGDSTSGKGAKRRSG
jgi:hypothetical protein